MTNCPKCNGTNFTITTVTLDGKDMYRVLECKDCRDSDMKKMLDEVAKHNPERLGAYSKTKLRTDYYGTVTIKDIKDET